MVFADNGRLTALRVLCEVPGRVIFPVGEDRRPLAAARPERRDWSWRKERFTDDELVHHVERGGFVGLCPASVGLWVLDIDQGGEDAVHEIQELLGRPLAWHPSRTKGHHVWFKLPRDGPIIGNQKWSYGAGAGELRGYNGYVVLWNLVRAYDALRRSDSERPVSPYPDLVPAPGERLAKEVPAEAVPPSARLVEAVEFLGDTRYGKEGPDYNDWILIGQAIHQETAGHPDGFDLWDTWSQRFVNYPSDGETSTLSKWNSFRARSDGVGGGTVFSLAESAGWTEDLTDEFEALADPPAGKSPDQSPDEPDRPPEQGIGRVMRNKRASTLARILTSKGIQVRHNERAKKEEVSTPSTSRWTMLHDYEALAIREEIAEWFMYQPTEKSQMLPLEFSSTLLNEHLGTLAWTRKVDPFKLWIESLTWDGVSRIDTWLETVWELAEENDADLVRWASRFLVGGAVRRTYEPGCKLDEMVILVGPPGTGKSSALRWLFPADEPTWFVDRFDYLAPEQRQVEKIMGAVIAEASEMAGIRRADIGHLKAAISSQLATIRLSYRRNPEDIPRRCIIVGTGDNEDILPNDPNLRRFVPVIIRKGSSKTVMAYLDTHRDQLWAEALHRYRQGEEARLPDELVEAQARITTAYRGRTETIDDLAARAPVVEDGEGLSLRDIMEIVDCPMHLERIFASALRDLGWEKRRPRLEGVRRKRWFSPIGWLSERPASVANLADDFEDLSSDFDSIL